MSRGRDRNKVRRSIRQVRVMVIGGREKLIFRLHSLWATEMPVILQVLMVPINLRSKNSSYHFSSTFICITVFVLNSTKGD